MCDRVRVRVRVRMRVCRRTTTSGGGSAAMRGVMTRWCIVRDRCRCAGLAATRLCTSLFLVFFPLVLLAPAVISSSFLRFFFLYCGVPAIEADVCFAFLLSMCFHCRF